MRQFPSSLFIPCWLRLSLVLLTLTFGVAWVTVAQAQESTPASATLVTANGVTADEVNAVASELWCPLCSGVRLDACELKACAQMREMIAQKLAEGEDSESIRAYFLDQYGPQVLGQPPLTGFNWLAWVLPFVVLAIGGFFLWNTMQRMVRPMSATVTSTEPSTGRIVTPGVTIPATPEDEYTGKLAEELKRYG